jgi:hypothetical protein
MPWQYNQTTGVISKDGIHVDKGYSGHDAGLNNPDSEALANIGPIPAGWWSIVGPPCDTTTHGPYCLGLSPDKDTMTFGRSGFLVHGDSKEFAGEHKASHGCIILARASRSRIWQSGDTRLLVVSGKEKPPSTPSQA